MKAREEVTLLRQRLVGRMLTSMSLVQPSYVPVEHTALLTSLEYASSDTMTREFMQESSVQEQCDKSLCPSSLFATEHNL